MPEHIFACPHCNKHLKAKGELHGHSVKCPSCKHQITIPSLTAQPPPLPVAPPTRLPAGHQSPQTCPLCARAMHMKHARPLYDYLVCKKCYYAFANRRQFAYMFDFAVFYIACYYAAMAVGVLLGAGVLSQSEVDNFGSILDWGLLFVAMVLKDCFSGQSVGKALCGVQVIDRTTGQPGGVAASLLRNLPLLIPIAPFWVASELCKGYRTGDGWARTKVIWKKYANHPVFAADLPKQEASHNEKALPARIG
jgi:uncharacterized RDD family membrane protein YckC